MVKRIVNTAFWTDIQVIDHYSVEDKYFSLYLMTNDKSTQLGIYSLPKKIMSFETGFTSEVIEVLLNRFSEKYGQIIYSEKTQEVALVNSLSYSILSGGKPVSDLLKREFRLVKDGQLILATYQQMKSFWESSSRTFDHTVQELFENELRKRAILFKEEEAAIDFQIEDLKNSERIKNERLVEDSACLEELKTLEKYIDYLDLKTKDLDPEELKENILTLFYKEKIGKLTTEASDKLKDWERMLPKVLVLEALLRSVGKFKPLSYATKIIENWKDEGVKTLREVKRLDRKYTHFVEEKIWSDEF